MNVRRIFGYLTSCLVVILGQLSPADAVTPRIYVSDTDGGSNHFLVVIDPATDTELTTIPVPAVPGELAPSPDGTKLLAMVADDLYVIDTASNTVLGIVPGVGGTIGDFNHVVAHPDGTTAYVATTVPYKLQIKVIDIPSLTMGPTIEDPLFSGCFAALGLEISSDGTKLYAACRHFRSSEPDRFYVIDTAPPNSVVKTPYERDNTNAFYINAITKTPPGGALQEVYVARVDSPLPDVLVFDPLTGANDPVRTIFLPAGDQPRAMAVCSDTGDTGYVVTIDAGMHFVDLTVTPPSITTTLGLTTSRGFDIAIIGGKAYTTLLTKIFVNDTVLNKHIGTITGGSLTNAKQITITGGDSSCVAADVTAPDAPINLTATAADGLVTLDWTPSASGDVVRQELCRRLTSGGPYDSEVDCITTFNDNTTSTYDDFGVVNGTTYYYVVRAFDAADNQSADSNEAEATPTSPGAGAACGPDDPVEQKVVAMTVKYAGGGCGASDNDQEKDECTEFNGGVGSPPVQPVCIQATDKKGTKVYTKDNGNDFVCGVDIGETVDIDAANAGRTKLGSKVFVTIYADANGSLGTKLELDNIHTSCSDELAEGDQFGSLLVTDLDLFAP